MIPIGPDFQDPAASPNFPPVLQDETPAAGSTFTVSDGMPRDVSVLASDMNPGDQLYYEWALDYPPYVRGTTTVFQPPPLPAPASGQQRQRILLPVKCDLGWALNGPTQRHLQLILSDRPLSSDLNTQLSNPDDPLAQDGWTVILNCLPPGSP